MLEFTVIGNIGGNAELHTENGQSYISFKVAHNESYTRADGSKVENTNWVSCILNGNADNLRQYLVKGQLVYVSGEGSVRTYHSEKQRCIVAGINIRVRSIQLLGAKPDAIPTSLVDDQGIIHPVQKYYNVGINTPKTLHDRQGNDYSVDEKGWVISAHQTKEYDGF